MKKFKWQKVLITVVVVIIGMCGIGWFTWNIGQLFLNIVSKSPVEDQNSVKVTSSEILILPKLDFWTCQIGVFKDEKNAQQMQGHSIAKGWKAEVIEGDHFIVAVGIFTSKEEAGFHNQIMEQKGIASWVKNESFPELHYKVNGQNVEKISTILRLSNFLIGGTPKEKIKGELAGDMDFLFAGGCPTDLQSINSHLLTILNSEYEEQDISYNQDLLKLFLEYKDITTKFLPNHKNTSTSDL